MGSQIRFELHLLDHHGFETALAEEGAAQNAPRFKQLGFAGVPRTLELVRAPPKGRDFGARAVVLAGSLPWVRRGLTAQCREGRGHAGAGWPRRARMTRCGVACVWWWLWIAVVDTLAVPDEIFFDSFYP